MNINKSSIKKNYILIAPNNRLYWEIGNLATQSHNFTNQFTVNYYNGPSWILVCFLLLQLLETEFLVLTESKQTRYHMFNTTEYLPIIVFSSE